MSIRGRPPRRARGMTLIEVLVALFVIVVGVLGSVSVLYFGLRHSANTIDDNTLAALAPTLQAVVAGKLRASGGEPVTADWTDLEAPGEEGRWVPSGYRARYQSRRHPARGGADPIYDRLYLVTLRLERLETDEAGSRVLRAVELPTLFLADRDWP